MGENQPEVLELEFFLMYNGKNRCALVGIKVTRNEASPGDRVHYILFIGIR